METNETKVSKLLSFDTASNSGDISKQLNINRTTVNAALMRLRARGKARRERENRNVVWWFKADGPQPAESGCKPMFDVSKTPLI